jgi:hypothetical protein
MCRSGWQKEKPALNRGDLGRGRLGFKKAYG